MRLPSPNPARRRWAIALAALGLVGTACDADDAPTSTDALTGSAVVFAASSLTDVYTALGDAFMVAHPAVEVTFSFAGSSDLAAQVTEGAPADVLATADTKNMQAAIDGLVAAGGDAPTPTVFATNQMQIVVGAGNPEGITGLTDLAATDLLVVLCAADVPCGKYAATVLEQAGVVLTPVSLEQNVKGVLSKVSLGEADAGIVYRTDVIAAGDAVTGVDIPADVNVTAEYPVVALTDNDVAAAFVAFVLSSDGRAILAKYGFGPS